MTEAKPSRLRVWMVKGFLLSVAVLLLFTATLKLFGRSPDMRVRMTPDPVVGFMKSRDMVALAGLLEYVVGIYLLFGRSNKLKLAAVLALTIAFVWYRFGLYIFTHSTSCRCLGTIPNAFVAETPMRYILYGMLLYMGLGSLFGLLLDKRVLGNRVHDAV